MPTDMLELPLQSRTEQWDQAQIPDLGGKDELKFKLRARVWLKVEGKVFGAGTHFELPERQALGLVGIGNAEQLIAPPQAQEPLPTGGFERTGTQEPVQTEPLSSGPSGPPQQRGRRRR